MDKNYNRYVGLVIYFGDTIHVNILDENSDYNLTSNFNLGDNFLDTIYTSGLVSISTDVVGVIDEPGDSDWFKIDLYK